MTHPLVVHNRRKPYDVYVARPSKWGNPFVIGRDGTREMVIAKYEGYIAAQPHLLAALHELRGKRLGCWCAPLPCHGDVLARLANAEPDNWLYRRLNAAAAEVASWPPEKQANINYGRPQ